MGNTKQPEHDILPVLPLFFFSGVTLAPRAGMTRIFHCAGNTKGREEVAHWNQLTANWPFPYCSLWQASSPRIMATMTRRVVAWKFLDKNIFSWGAFGCAWCDHAFFFFYLTLDESRTCTCLSRFNNCSSDCLYSPLLWVGSCSELLSGALDHDVTPRSSLNHWKASGSVLMAQLNRIVLAIMLIKSLVALIAFVIVSNKAAQPDRKSVTEKIFLGGKSKVLISSLILVLVFFFTCRHAAAVPYQKSTGFSQDPK